MRPPPSGMKTPKTPGVKAYYGIGYVKEGVHFFHPLGGGGGKTCAILRNFMKPISLIIYAAKNLLLAWCFYIKTQLPTTVNSNSSMIPRSIGSV